MKSISRRTFKGIDARGEVALCQSRGTRLETLLNARHGGGRKVQKWGIKKNRPCDAGFFLWNVLRQGGIKGDDTLPSGSAKLSIGSVGGDGKYPKKDAMRHKENRSNQPGWGENRTILNKIELYHLGGRRRAQKGACSRRYI